MIRTVHGQGFRFVASLETAEPAPGPAGGAEDAGAALRREVLSRPVLAVLPFGQEGGGPEEAYFVDGLTEEVIVELASWRWIPVLARASAFDPRFAALPAVERARALGARYALVGRLRRGAGGARLSVELLDTETATQLWSGRFDCAAPELPGLQETIAAEVLRQIAPELTSAETRRVMRKRPEDLSAWDLTLKGLWHFHRGGPEEAEAALGLLEAAAKADPGFALPWSLIALTRFEAALRGWTGGARGAIRDAFRDMHAAASRATALDPGGWMGHALMAAGELWTNYAFPRARYHANRALELNPSASMAYHFSGCIHGFAGDLASAAAQQETVFRLDPAYPHLDVVQADLGLWRLLQGDLEAAARHLDAALGHNPRNVRARQRQVVLAGLAGDDTLARRAREELVALGGMPDEAYWKASYPFQDPEHAARFREGLRAAEGGAA
jgi:TolB-like protein